MANTEKQFLDEEGLEIVRNNTFIPVFDTWEEYEEAKDTVPEGMKFIIREDENDSLGNKMDKINPSGGGALSINRKAGSTIGGSSACIGNANEATAWCSIAVGQDNIVEYPQGFACGYQNKVYSSNGCATGSGNLIGVEGDTDPNGVAANAFVSGANNNALGANSTVHGFECKAIGVNSFASGSGSIAYAVNSAAMGAGVTCHFVGGLTCGTDNIEDETGSLIFIVGNGTSRQGGSPNNAFSVRANGDAIVDGALYVNSIILRDQVTGAPYTFSIQDGQISVQPIVGDRGSN